MPAKCIIKHGKLFIWGGILTGSNTPPTFSVSFEYTWVCVCPFLFVQLVLQKKRKLSGASLYKKRQSFSVYLSMPLRFMKSKNLQHSGQGKRVLSIFLELARPIVLIEMGRGLKGFRWVRAKTLESGS